MDCSITGKINITADACLFTPSSADYGQTYNVHTVLTDDTLSNDAACIQTISAADSKLNWVMSYDQATTCGFGWGSDATSINFGGKLRASDNINTVQLQE